MASPVVYNGEKPHVVCVPYPAQGHINPMLKVAKLLYARGFHVTFVNTVYNHNRLIRSRGPHAVKGLPFIRFESIPDGLPETDVDVTQDITALCDSTMKNCLTPFKELLQRINAGDDVPPVSCIVADGCMSFTLDAAEELGVPEVLFWTTGASAFMIYLHFYLFIEKGLAPIKDHEAEVPAITTSSPGHSGFNILSVGALDPLRGIVGNVAAQIPELPVCNLKI